MDADEEVVVAENTELGEDARADDDDERGFDTDAVERDDDRGLLAKRPTATATVPASMSRRVRWCEYNSEEGGGGKGTTRASAGSWQVGQPGLISGISRHHP